MDSCPNFTEKPDPPESFPRSPLCLESSGTGHTMLHCWESDRSMAESCPRGARCWLTAVQFVKTQPVPVMLLCIHVTMKHEHLVHCRLSLALEPLVQPGRVLECGVWSLRRRGRGHPQAQVRTSEEDYKQQLWCGRTALPRCSYSEDLCPFCGRRTRMRSLWWHLSLTPSCSSCPLLTHPLSVSR